VFEVLYRHESQVTELGMQRRLYQALSAYGQALAIDPDDPRTYERLVPVYLATGKIDLALQSRNRYELITGEEFPGPPDEAQAERWDEMWSSLRQQVSEVEKRSKGYVEQNQPRLDAALHAFQFGCSALALELLDEEPELLEQSIDARRLRAMTLLEAARPREAFELLAETEPMAAQQGIPGFKEPLAFASLALPDFGRAEAMWRDIADESAFAQLGTTMRALPLAGPVNGAAMFPLWQTAEARRSLEEHSEQVALAEFNAALCEMEAGETEAAEKSLVAMLAKQPLTRLTGLASFYLGQIRGRPYEIRIDLRDPERRFAEIESRLNRSVIAGQLKSSGPVQAKKPASETRPAGAPTSVRP
jgi:tetratricopeptide (TPR) repeat protein